MADLHALPSVEQLLQSENAVELAAAYGRPLTLRAVRAALDEARRASLEGREARLPTPSDLLEMARSALTEWTRPTLSRVINASGVILHTNLGRAPLSASAREAMQSAAQGYTNLEYDLVSGRRGSRLVHAEALLQDLTGGEAALVVNNNAAALLLALTVLAARKRVVIARSQLVEVGGGFRIPDVLRQSGAKLVEVGTTNRTHLDDYRQALEAGAALVLRAHPSNFRIIGFTEEPELAEIVQETHKHGCLVVDDLGSGALLDTAHYGLAHEPTVQESLALGADVVCFSGDKLLGGPQAGLIVGRQALLDKMKKHPLARALRADKVRLAGLMATLLHYLKDEAEQEIPVWRMIALDPQDLRERALSWAQALGQGEVVESQSTVGGGSLPGESLPTFALALAPDRPDRFLAALRGAKPAIVGRVEHGRVLLDPRTVLPDEEPELLAGVAGALATPSKSRAAEKA